MHVLYLAPEHPRPHREFVRALKEVGARVSGIGHRHPARLDAEIQGLLDDYRAVRSLFDPKAVLAAAEALSRTRTIDRIEATDETLVEVAAGLREPLGCPGLSARTALLCRDKTLMKETLRRAGVPCAASASVASNREALAFAERVGYPLIVKPKAGLGTQGTSRVENGGELLSALAEFRLGTGGSAAIEEFIEGHEGFYDTLTIGGEVRHEYIAHYYPNVLVAMRDRSVCPQIAATNRIDAPGYEEVKRIGRTVIEAFGIETSATHMEWFFGPKGLRFSEIGARPPGERIWDLHSIGNELDLYREWASAIVHGHAPGTPSRRYATGSIQVRPSQDGKIVAHRGLDRVLELCGDAIVQSNIPAAGTPTRPMRLGYLENSWFRLRHPDYDHLRSLMDQIGQQLTVHATPA